MLRYTHSTKSKSKDWITRNQNNVCSEAACLPRTVVSVNKHNKNPTLSVGLEQRSLYCIIPPNIVMSSSLCNLLSIPFSIIYSIIFINTNFTISI